MKMVVFGFALMADSNHWSLSFKYCVATVNQKCVCIYVKEKTLTLAIRSTVFSECLGLLFPVIAPWRVTKMDSAVRVVFLPVGSVSKYNSFCSVVSISYWNVRECDELHDQRRRRPQPLSLRTYSSSISPTSGHPSMQTQHLSQRPSSQNHPSFAIVPRSPLSL